MRQVPDDVRAQLAALPVCRANGISPRVLVPEFALEWLKDVDVRGGEIEEVDDLRERVLAFGRRHVGAPYRMQASIQEAPAAFSCSTFVKYAFAEVGIWMPRYAVDQSYVGRPVERHGCPPASLAFYKSEHPVRDPSRAVGHVAIVTAEDRMIHAGNRRRDVHEFTPKCAHNAAFTDPFPPDARHLLLLPPEPRGFETALDAVRWMQR